MWISRRRRPRRRGLVLGLTAAGLVLSTATGAVAFQSARANAPSGAVQPPAVPPPAVKQQPVVEQPPVVKKSPAVKKSPDVKQQPAVEQPSGYKPLVIGHKGAVEAAVRNTVPAMRAAFRRGADGIEFDIVRTQDNALVVMSSTNLDASTRNCTGSTEEHPFAYVRTCRTLDGAPLPTLDDALRVARASKGMVFVHVKIRPNPVIAATIMEAINEYGLNRPDRATIFGPYPQMLDILLAQGAPRVGLLFNDLHKDAGWAANYPVLIPYNTSVTPALVRATQARGIEVFPVEGFPLTVDEALAMEVDGMILDSIAEARSAVGPAR